MENRCSIQQGEEHKCWLEQSPEKSTVPLFLGHPIYDFNLSSLFKAFTHCNALFEALFQEFILQFITDTDNVWAVPPALFQTGNVVKQRMCVLTGVLTPPPQKKKKKKLRLTRFAMKLLVKFTIVRYRLRLIVFSLRALMMHWSDEWMHDNLTIYKSCPANWFFFATCILQYL